MFLTYLKKNLTVSSTEIKEGDLNSEFYLPAAIDAGIKSGKIPGEGFSSFLCMDGGYIQGGQGVFEML